MSDQQSYPPCTALYAGCIHESIRGGDRERMRAVEAQASQYVNEVREALEELRTKLGGNS
jgi:hypothetical protein